jgi:hypothetical protein
VSKRVSLFVALCLPVGLLAQESAPGANEAGLIRTYTVSMSAGLTSTFQPPLGPTFGAGPAIEDVLSFSVNNVFRKDDSVIAFGWNTTDVPSITPDWMAGLRYKTPIIRRKNHSLTLTGGFERWILRDVESGSNDWILHGNLTYATKLRNIPFFVAEDSYSLLSSTLARGSGSYTRLFTQHTLLKRENFQLLARQGPEYTYSWNFYGVSGNCVMRYGGSLVAAWKGNEIEAGYRRQYGLQSGVPTDNYWSFAISRHITRPF